MTRFPLRVSGISTTRRSGMSGCGISTSISNASSCGSSTRSATERIRLQGIVSVPSKTSHSAAVLILNRPSSSSWSPERFATLSALLAYAVSSCRPGRPSTRHNDSEEAIISGCDHEISVGRSKHLIRGHEGCRVPLSLGALAGGQVALKMVRKQPSSRLVKTHLHQGAGSRLRLVPKGCLDPNCSPHACPQIDRGDSQSCRSLIGMTVHRHHACLGLENGIVTRRIFLGSL